MRGEISKQHGEDILEILLAEYPSKLSISEIIKKTTLNQGQVASGLESLMRQGRVQRVLNEIEMGVWWRPRFSEEDDVVVVESWFDELCQKILDFVGENPGFSSTDLERKFDISENALTRRLNRLHEAGYIADTSTKRRMLPTPRRNGERVSVPFKRRWVLGPNASNAKV